jgi:hypothetical protein
MCAICRDVMADAVSIPCGHEFCSNCLWEYCPPGASKPCPLCRQEFGTGRIAVSWPRRRVIDALKTKCEACAAEVLLRDWANHEAKTCPQRLEECKQCALKVLAKDLATHAKNECPRRAVACEQCHKRVRLSAMAKHAEKRCPQRTVECPRCKAAHPAAAEIAHRRECPEMEVVCDLAGCDARLKRKDLPKHQAEDVQAHVLKGLKRARETEIADEIRAKELCTRPLDDVRDPYAPLFYDAKRRSFHCTLARPTDRVYAPQVAQQCFTCRPQDRGASHRTGTFVGACVVCAAVCHRGHDLGPPRFFDRFFCDCGGANGMGDSVCVAMGDPSEAKPPFPTHIDTESESEP